MANQGNAARAAVQWSLLPLVFIVIGLGWRWPLLGFVVPVVMIAGMAGGILNGRYVCGNLCPRGGFFDRLGPFFSKSRPIPQALRAMWLRWTLFAALMGFMIWRIAQDPGSVYHWGKVFWLMCTVTTAAGVVLAILFHPRTWCSICPVGTAANAFGGHKNPLTIDASKCRECRACEKACPIALDIVRHRTAGVVAERDCVKCDECIVKCPMKALAWPGDGGAPACEKKPVPETADASTR
jgi:ferredoxin-type protein NapH